MIHILATIAAILFLTAPVSAAIGGMCIDKTSMLNILRDQGKTVIGHGIMPGEDDSALAIILVMDPDGNWSFLFTRNSVMMCEAAAGDGWTIIEPTIPGKDS